MISAQLTSINFRFFLSLVIVFFSFMCVCGESNYRFLQPLLEHSRSSSTGRSVSTIHKSILPSLSFLQQYPAPAPPYPQGFYASPFPQSTSQDTPSGNLYQSYVRERQAVSNQPFTDSSPSMSEVDGKGFRRLAIGAGALSGAFVGAYGAGGVGTAIIGATSGALIGGGIRGLYLKRPSPAAMDLRRRINSEREANQTIFWPIFFGILIIATVAVCAAVATAALSSKGEEFYEELRQGPNEKIGLV